MKLATIFLHVPVEKKGESSSTHIPLHIPIFLEAIHCRREAKVDQVATQRNTTQALGSIYNAKHFQHEEKLTSVDIH